MLTEEMKENLRQFVAENVDHWEGRYDWALEKIGRYRCPLYHADYELYEDIESCVEDWCDIFEIDKEDIEIEELFG